MVIAFSRSAHLFYGWVVMYFWKNKQKSKTGKFKQDPVYQTLELSLSVNKLVVIKQASYNDIPVYHLLVSFPFPVLITFHMPSTLFSLNCLVLH